jgi:hypothetical protein
MMQYRGADDDVVGFGHFSEVRRVKAGPDDVVVPPKGTTPRAVVFLRRSLRWLRVHDSLRLLVPIFYPYALFGMYGT